MIVKMKKVSLVVQEKRRQSALKKLRRAGVMHIQREPETGAVPENLKGELGTLEKALAYTAQYRGKAKSPDTTLSRVEANAKAEEIIQVQEREILLLARLSQFAKDAEVLSPWGDFDPVDIRILLAKGIDIRLIKAGIETQERLRSDPHTDFFPVRRKKDVVFGVLVYCAVPEDGGETGIQLPEHGLSELRTLVDAAKGELVSVREELAALAAYSKAIQHAAAAVRQDIEFEEVRASLSAEAGLAGFTGFVPVDSAADLKALAARESWGLMLQDPELGDAVPTLVKNSAAVRIIQPVFSLMGIFPGYREPDISVWFLTFLSVFVAMILGDAAYGTIILLLTGAVFLKTRKSSDTLRLITIFGLTTLIWGAVTGTWFSSLALVRDTPLRHLVVPALATYQEELFPGYAVRMKVFPNDALDATAMMMWISLLLGILMIVIARVQNFVRKLPSLAAIAQLGWLSIVLAMYWLIMSIVLQLSPLPFIMELTFPMIIGGLLTVLVFGGQEKGHSFWRGLLEGLKNLLPTLLNSIGAFGDIISYIRLFAVGLVGVALAQSFNAMAPRGGGFAVIAAAAILVFGHTLNIMLNALSVLVHGVRLNVLEFSGHLDMEWAGIGFDPFRLRVPEAESPETDKE